MDQAHTKQLLIVGLTYMRESASRNGHFLEDARGLRDACVKEGLMRRVLAGRCRYSNEKFPSLELRANNNMLFCLYRKDDIVAEILVCSEFECEISPERCSFYCQRHENLNCVAGVLKPLFQNDKQKEEEHGGKSARFK